MRIKRELRKIANNAANERKFTYQKDVTFWPNLYMRVMLFLGEKPYVCTSEGCGKRFTEYSSLYKHHVIHTHQKPYVCIHCGKTYRQASTLAMHRRMAHSDSASSEPTAAAATAMSPAIFLTTSENHVTLLALSIDQSVYQDTLIYTIFHEKIVHQWSNAYQ